MKKLTIRIKNDGHVTMRVAGAVGEECLDFTRAFEQAAGDVKEREMLPECEVDELSERTNIEEKKNIREF